MAVDRFFVSGLQHDVCTVGQRLWTSCSRPCCWDRTSWHRPCCRSYGLEKVSPLKNMTNLRISVKFLWYTQITPITRNTPLRDHPKNKTLVARCSHQTSFGHQPQCYGMAGKRLRLPRWMNKNKGRLERCRKWLVHGLKMHSLSKSFLCKTKLIQKSKQT